MPRILRLFQKSPHKLKWNESKEQLVCFGYSRSRSIKSIPSEKECQLAIDNLFILALFRAVRLFFLLMLWDAMYFHLLNSPDIRPCSCFTVNKTIKQKILQNSLHFSRLFQSQSQSCQFCTSENAMKMESVFVKIFRSSNVDIIPLSMPSFISCFLKHVEYGFFIIAYNWNPILFRLNDRHCVNVGFFLSYLPENVRHQLFLGSGERRKSGRTRITYIKS